jgi:hypothetical protein
VVDRDRQSGEAANRVKVKRGGQQCPPHFPSKSCQDPPGEVFGLSD